MTGASHLKPEFVEFILDRLEPGVLYISRRYATASHLCCCGCEREVVTPLNPAKWRITERAAKVSLTPSIGNWSFPCRSHYWISANSRALMGICDGPGDYPSCSSARSSRCRTLRAKAAKLDQEGI